MTQIYLYLAASIVMELLGTSFMKTTQGFTRPLQSMLVLLAYAAAAFFFSKTVDRIPLGIVYSVWCGAGIILVSLTAYFVYGQVLDWAALLGIFLIASGIVTIHLYSNTLA
jgi:small multidrug resistance pump